MKKIYIAALTVLAAAAMSSCVQEKSFDDKNIGENGIVFSLQGAAATRAAEVSMVEKGVTLELDANENGEKLYLEETIEDLNYASAATRGTPAYTENVGKLYKDLRAVIIQNGETPKTLFTDNFWAMDNEMVAGGWRYQGEFGAWPDEDTPLDFYLWMPVSDNGITGTPTCERVEVTINDQQVEKQRIRFNYTTPAKAEDQKDLIFAARPMSKAEAKSKTYRTNGVPVLFNHVLTGVKFAIANYDAEKKITIKSVTFNGLVKSGTCVVMPASENNYKDNTSTYSSADANVVSWTPGTTTGSFTIENEFGTPVSYASSTTEDGKKVNGKFTNGLEYPDSFAAAGATDNLNDGNASQTFWFIPQEMNDNVTLTIVYTYGSDEPKEGVLNFGEALALKGVTWKAGQLRTYTIRVDEVNVKIEDSVTLTTTDEYKGSTKEDVVITNTGNTDAYIRAAIIGQWLNEEGNPVFGFTDFTAKTQDEQYVLVESWYQDQFSATGQHKHGAFKNLVGYKNDTDAGTPGTTVFTSDWWFKGDDGFYYFKYVVPADKAIPENGTKYIAVTASGTTETTGTADPLFESYTIKDAPDARVAGHKETIYFELEIATQAITAKKVDGTYYTLEEAWAKAGVTVTE